MKPEKMKPTEKPLVKNVLSALLSNVRKKVSVYFEPEEVEVTFEEGKKDEGTYTYTVLPHKQVA